MKKLMIAVAVMLLAATAFAQDAAAPPPAKVTLEFDAQQLQWLGQAINELPKRIADPLLVDVQRQLGERQKAITAAEKVKADAAAKAEK